MSLQSEDCRPRTGFHHAAMRSTGLLVPNASRKEVARLEFHIVGCSNSEPSDPETDTPDDAPLSPRQGEENQTVGMLHLQEETVTARIEAAQREARLDAREEWERELVERLSDERNRVLRACERFNEERSKYFAEVEKEIVKLALAIAARVLNREAQCDPLLLSATVRIALEKVAEESGVVIRVPDKDLAAWGEIVKRTAQTGVELVGDEQMEVGECVLDTRVGTVELGVRAQLAEIERGFFDLLQWRPS